ncbi:hypothetical protein V493_05295, partial [Pseudogymnoascus sp. VKM F-4281 (FW-2241)]
MTTTWKEIGVVPDSDDEDDSLDSQTTTWNPDQYDDVHAIPDVPPTLIPVETETDATPIQDIIYKQPNCSQTNVISQQLVTGELPPEIQSKTPPENGNSSNPLDGSDPSQDLQHQSSPILAAARQSTPCLAEDTVQEEVSRSYVGLLSSPTSSLSSLGSTPSQSPYRASILPLDNEEQSETSHVVPGLSSEEVTQQRVSIFDDANNFESAGRRSFRPRTEIQLHPYLLDSERHRRDFMARGLRPMRFTPAQQMAQGAPQNGDSQDTEFEVEEDSQKTGAEDSYDVLGTIQTLMSSPTRSARSVLEIDDELQSFPSSFRSVGLDSDDVELPDIRTLIDQARKGIVGRKQIGNSSRQRTHGTGHPRPKGPQHASNASETPLPAIIDVFDVPQSPPMTSPHVQSLTAWANTTERPLSGHGSDVTARFGRNNGNAQHGLGVTDLPTPATSSVRRANDHPDEICVVGEDPFISSSEEAGAPQSSPPKEPTRVPKLLRGVLPASHFRVNPQTRGQQNAPRTAARDSFNHSPLLPEIRRGIALPRVAEEITASARVNPRTGLGFLSDESDEEDFGTRGIVKESGQDSQPLFSQSDFGFATEDNAIDQMIVPKKRQRTLFSDAASRKKRRVNTSLFKPTHGTPSYQPRISELLPDPSRTPVSTQRNTVKRSHGQSLAQEVLAKINSRSRPLPRNIQEVMPNFSEPVTHQPKFIRIAARSAGSRHALGRQGPVRKFVRLDNREDTIDAQSVLREWRGKPAKYRTPSSAPRSPLRVVSEESRNQRSLPSNNSKIPAVSHTTRRLGNNPKVRVTNHQTKISWASTNPQAESRVNLAHNKRRKQYSTRPSSNRARAPYSAPQPRSAQLEVLEDDYSNRDRRSAFGSTKRNLDKSYERYQNGSVTANHIPLARFLANEGLVDNRNDTSEPDTGSRGEERIGNNVDDRGIPQARRQRKRTPKQLDATAARFRQPDKPVLIAPIEIPTPSKAVHDYGGKLYGLGDADTDYSIDFDIFPLRSGVYFHESTFIGQGKLAKAIGTESSKYHDHHRGYASAQFGAQHVKWGVWDADVSSEIGVYFDWIVSRLNSFGTASLNAVQSDVEEDTVRCMLFMIDYFQNTLAFNNREELELCLQRMIDVMERLTQCLEVLASTLDFRDDFNNRRIMDLSVFEVILIFQALRLSATHSGSVGQRTTGQLEALLQRTATPSVKLLFIVGLSSVQSLYDDLQYLASREAGIKSSENPTQAWVILMHIMHAARIPRVTFWYAVNLQLLENISMESDARVLEKTWYSAFSLLPLMEFNELGVLVTRSRYRATAENWLLPQKIAKRLFELYASDAEQPPNFNNYCRATFSRCHHLIQVWGWRRYGSIVGTFFDFFASHGFSHIGRSEMLGTSPPEFINDLDGALSSAIDSEDQCFHIFLKIVHSAIKQLREAGEAREIRNLVTRLLPNHDLQYQEGPCKATNTTSLRNHRDLLSTLYWAAPAEVQHKINMMLGLVNREISKKEAYSRNASCLHSPFGTKTHVPVAWRSERSTTTASAAFPQSRNPFHPKYSPDNRIGRHNPIDRNRRFTRRSYYRMHAAAWGALRTTRRPQLWRTTCRVIAGVRRPLPSRNFHRSAVAYRIPDDPADPKTGAENGTPKNATEEESNTAPEEPAPSEPVAKTDTVTGGQRTKRGDYGSAARRANRNVRVKEVPPVVLPDWFLERNVRPSGANDNVERILLLEDRTAPEKEQESVKLASEKAGGEPAPTPEGTSEDATLGPDQKVRYSMKNIVFQELQSNIEATLSIRPPKGVDPKEIIRPDILLQCPQRDASGFMNQVVDTVAFKLNADVVRLDPDDIAQIVGEYMGENLAWTPCTTSLLGYELDKVGRYEEEMNRAEEETDEMEMDEGEDPQKPEMPNLSALTSALKAGSSKLRGLTIIPGAGGQRSLSKPMSFDELFGQGPNQSPTRSTSSSESWSNFKLTAALEALVDASYNNATKSTSVTSTADSSSTETPAPKPTIIQINQYKEMGKIDAGINILKMLRDIVKKRWLEGRHIAIIGTTTAGDPVPATTLDSIVQLQSDVVFGDQRTIMVTPAKTQDMEALKIDEKHRNRRVNIRHLKDMVSKLSNGKSAPLIDHIVENFLSTRNVAPPEEPQVWSDLHTKMVEDLEESIWPYPRVHRLATVMIGSSDIDLTHAGNSSLLAAYDIIAASDEEKAAWMKKDDRKKSSTTSSSKETAADQKRKQIKLNATLREKKLLGGVVHPENIKVTFSDVRAPADTIDALKTLTSLSLIRPEAFSYGVLAKDKIPGVLLYGPPGTGKTMLAKALAKESDTTVLEVSGSEIYDKYVGEGEKNVKAVFSLAKKLAPCIVFIDEADAIFGDRGAGSQRTSHREIINEFLREWDGMNDLSAFIMVATNRPFDLDEAILRRLPRRLLIDLPVEADREAILRIHLQGEELEDSVDLAALAANTPFYSGSDLKNLSVAAALACVREETTTATAAAAASATEGEDVSALSKNLTYPAKRILAKRHFEIAIQEISASVSEDMQTLAAIRKFDERYGDRKGRKKKTVMGFGREKEAVDEEGAR